MSTIESSAYCATCGRITLHRKERANHILHLLLSIVTAGLWLIVWAFIVLTPHRSRCAFCGRQPGWAEFRRASGLTNEPSPPTHRADGDEVPPSTWLPPGARPPRA